MSDVDVELKILIIGDAGVGKTCVLLRYADNTFTENYFSTIGFDYKTKDIEVNGLKVRLQIWDTAGQERFRGITQSYYRGAHGIIVAYDVTDKKSFENATTMWLEEIRKYGTPESKTMLIGCKNDDVQNREVQYHEGNSIAEGNHITFYETSSASAFNIELCFSTLASVIIASLPEVSAKLENKRGVIKVSNARPLQLPKGRSGCSNC